MTSLPEDDLVSPEQAPNSETMQRFLAGYKRLPPPVGVVIHLPDPSTGVPTSATYTFTRSQFEALAYGWEMLSTSDNQGMLQLVQMGLLYPPVTPRNGPWLFKLTDAGIEMCERLHGGNVRVVLTEDVK